VLELDYHAVAALIAWRRGSRPVAPTRRGVGRDALTEAVRLALGRNDPADQCTLYLMTPCQRPLAHTLATHRLGQRRGVRRLLRPPHRLSSRTWADDDIPATSWCTLSLLMAPHPLVHRPPGPDRTRRSPIAPLFLADRGHGSGGALPSSMAPVSIAMHRVASCGAPRRWNADSCVTGAAPTGVRPPAGPPRRPSVVAVTLP